MFPSGQSFQPNGEHLALGADSLMRKRDVFSHTHLGAALIRLLRRVAMGLTSDVATLSHGLSFSD